MSRLKWTDEKKEEIITLLKEYSNKQIVKNSELASYLNEKYDSDMTPASWAATVRRFRKERLDNITSPGVTPLKIGSIPKPATADNIVDIESVLAAIVGASERMHRDMIDLQEVSKNNASDNRNSLGSLTRISSLLAANNNLLERLVKVWEKPLTKGN